MKQNVKYALMKSLPVMAGYIFLGIAFGIVLVEAGFNVWWAILISLFVYAGSLQFVMVPLLAAAVSPWTMAATALFVNFRHVFYGLSFVESFKQMKTRLYMVWSLTDETYSVLCGCKNEDPEEKNKTVWFLISIFDHSYWITGSVIGALIGQALAFDFTGIDFSMTALFVVILLEQVLSNPQKKSLYAIIGLVVGTIGLLIFGTDKFLLPTLIVVMLIISPLSVKKEKREVLVKDGTAMDRMMVEPKVSDLQEEK